MSEPTTADLTQAGPAGNAGAAAGEATLLDQYIAAVQRKKQLQAQAKLASEAASDLEQRLLDQFEAEHVSAKKTAAGATVHIIRKVWARPAGGKAGRPAAVDALIAAGLDTYVQPDFNVHSLSAYFRGEIERRAEEGSPVTDVAELLRELHPELDGAIELTDDHRLGIAGS